MQIQNWLLGGGLTLILGMMGLLIRVSYRIGGDARDITKGLDTIKSIEIKLEKIPMLEKDIVNLQNLYGNIRSDIKELLRDKRGSRPDIGT